MYPHFKDYFQFSKTEKRGIAALTMVIVLILLIKESLIYFYPAMPLKRVEHDSLIEAIKQSVEQNQQLEALNRKKDRKNTNEFTFFDPNNLHVDDWKKMGLTEKQAAVIERYRSKGGRFNSKEDVKKMYVISDSLFEQMKEFILLPDQKAYEATIKYEKDKSRWKGRKVVKNKVDINSAESAQWKDLSGIGEILSARIVSYRNRLGGFHSKNQLREVYGLKEEVLIALDSQLILENTHLRQLNINTATIEELKSHPYISWQIANSIVKYREQHGTYDNIEELTKLVLVDKAFLNKISPYLTVKKFDKE